MSELKKWSNIKEYDSKGTLIKKIKRLQDLQQSLTANSVQVVKELQVDIDGMLEREVLE